MPASKSQTAPLKRVTDEFGGKAKLVDALIGLLDRGEESKDEQKARLLAAANSKLLRLHRTATQVKEQFGGKGELVDKLLGLMNRAKDGDYRAKLMGFTPTRLLASYRSWERRA